MQFSHEGSHNTVTVSKTVACTTVLFSLSFEQEITSKQTSKKNIYLKAAVTITNYMFLSMNQARYPLKTPNRINKTPTINVISLLNMSTKKLVWVIK